MKFFNNEANKKAVEMGLFNSIEEIMEYETKIIEEWYPGFENLTAEEIQTYYRCQSEHQFQVLIALNRKTTHDKLKCNDRFELVIFSQAKEGLFNVYSCY